MDGHPSPAPGAAGDATMAAALADDLDGTFERLVVDQQDRLYTIALRMLGDARDAEEAAQDAFVRAYRALERYDGARVRELRVRGWLTTILLNVCRNRVRRPGPTLVAIDRRGPADEPAPADQLASTDAAANPHEATVRREGATRWARLVTTIPPLYRAAIVLRHVDGLSYAEMSEVLGRPEGTLKAQVHRGLAMLRTAAESSDETGRPSAQEMSA